MTLVTPANAKGPVPVMMMFGSAAFLKRMADMMASRPELKATLGSDPPSMEQLIAGGWGYALIDPAQHSSRTTAQGSRRESSVWRTRAASKAGRLGCAAGVGVGRVARARLSGNRQGGGCASAWASKASPVMGRPRW